MNAVMQAVENMQYARRRWLILATVAIAQLMIVLDLGDHDVPVGSELQVKGAKFGVGDQARRAQRSGAVEHDDGVVALSGRRDA